ncbi:MAG: leucine-rich repeat protein [Clostridia bacterium]|nr:leucine-rich repeat protein [Clostridia bacterium]
MAICPHCKGELSKQDNGNLYCENCNKLFKVKTEEVQAALPETQQPTQEIEQTQQTGSQNANSEIEILKARLAVVEAEKELAKLQLAQQRVSTQTQNELQSHYAVSQEAKNNLQQENNFQQSKSSFSEKASLIIHKIGESAAWDWCKKHWIILFAGALLLIAFITLMSTLVGIRGIYVNVNNPNDFYSFTATDYVGYITDEFGYSYEENGTWKTSGNKLTFTVKDEYLGKISEDFLYSTKHGYKTLFIGDDKENMVEYQRVSLVKYDINTDKAKVTFDLNGGDGKNDIKKIKIGNKLDEPTTPTHTEGYAFMGWYTTPYGYKSVDGQRFDDDSRIWENTTYYANWDNPTEYTVTIKHRYADALGTELKTIQLKEGDKLLPALTESISSSYSFFGANDVMINENSYMPPQNIEIIYDYSNAFYAELDKNFEFTLLPTGTYSITCKNNNIEEAIIPEIYHGKYVTAIERNAFKDCYNLKSVSINMAIVNYIGEYSFYNCSQITFNDYFGTVTLTSFPDFVYIGDYAFYNAKDGIHFFLNCSFVQIGAYAYANCDIPWIYYLGSKSEWMSNSNVSTGENWNLDVNDDFFIHCFYGNSNLDKNGNEI